MTGFEESKTAKLKRLPVLRLMNATGMITWRDDRYGGAEQRLRMLHPLSWPWLIAMVLYAAAAYGVVEVAKEVKIIWRDECVWW